MTRTKGQSEAARNARLDRCACPTHGLYMSQIAGWWYPLDGQPFTLVACGRADCDVICISYGEDGPVSEPLSESQLHTLHGEHGMRWEIEYFTHFMRRSVLDEARRRRDTGALSADDFAALEQHADQLTTIARALIAALDAPKEDRKP